MLTNGAKITSSSTKFKRRVKFLTLQMLILLVSHTHTHSSTERYLKYMNIKYKHKMGRLEFPSPKNTDQDFIYFLHLSTSEKWNAEWLLRILTRENDLMHRRRTRFLFKWTFIFRFGIAKVSWNLKSHETSVIQFFSFSFLNTI